MAALTNVWVLTIVPIMFLLTYILLKFYMNTYRELSRLGSVTHSPIINHFAETLSGATTIRNYNKKAEFIEIYYNIQNTNLNVEFWKLAVRRWFAIRILITSQLLII
jgi:ATP-binding cassette, subfamily C (CFTR/MRP), member 1